MLSYTWISVYFYSRGVMEIAFVVGGLGFEFCVFVAGWRHALRSEWPFIIILMEIELYPCLAFPSKSPNGA